jgi:hypothetical protein
VLCAPSREKAAPREVGSGKRVDELREKTKKRLIVFWISNAIEK